MLMNHELLITRLTLPGPYSAATQFGGVTDWYQSQVIENQWVSDAEPHSPDAPLQSLEQAPPSLDYVPGPEHPPSPNYDQPLPIDASPTALSSGYVADSYLKEDPEEDPKVDPEEDLTDYPADGRDDDNEEEESCEDDDDDDDDDEDEAFEEASEEDEDEKEEHLALANSTAATPPPPPRSPRTKVPFSQICLHRAQKTVRLQPPMAASTKALIVEFSSTPTPPSPPPSPLSPRSSPLLHIPSPPLPVLSPPLPLPAASPSTHQPLLSLDIPPPPFLVPSTAHRDDIPEADMPLRKRARFSAPASRFKVGESLTAATARQTGHTLAHRVDYSFFDIVDASIRAFESRVMTAVEEVNKRVIDLVATQRQDAHEL
ncbi:hypothetical protein Tco_1230369 [Tanacetum coccineum]